MSTLVFVESADDELSQQAVVLAASLGADVQPVAIDGGGSSFAPAAWAQTLVDYAGATGATAIVAPGTDRGNEVLAHVAAKLDQPMAANCTKIAPGSPAAVTRVRWGGSLLEEAQLDGSPLLLTSAAHAVAAEPIAGVETIALSDGVSDADRAVRVLDTVAAGGGGVSLADADVVVSGGRGVGSAEGFSEIEELAALLGAAVGCSRAVTSAGWRPHSDQVGQTGTKISPEIYIACGISGATQHMAGCKGAKRLLAINPDGDASIFSSADYGVIGDLHEVVPAISEQIRKVRGVIGVAVGAVALGLALWVSAALFADRVEFLVTLIRAGAPLDRSGGRRRRVRNETTIVLGQRKLLQRFVPGLIHALIFWGFLVLGPTIVIAMVGAVSKHATIPWLGDQGWYALLVDIFAVLALVGVVSALYIRKVVRPPRFDGSHLGEADLILGLIAMIVISLLLWHASRIALGLNEWPRDWAPVSHLISHLFADNQTTRVLERVFVWIHVLTILGFLAYLPRSKHLHIASAAFNVWYGRTGPGGKLETLRFDDPSVPEEEIRFGAGTAADLTWKEMLDTYSCTECGRCQDACPAFATGKTLSPKLVIMGLRDQVFADGASVIKMRAAPGEADGPELAPLVPTAVPEESIWDCVTCGACVQACPVSIEHVDHIVDLRRHLVMVESSFPSEAEPMLRDIERASNPWGKAQSERADWADGLGVRILEVGDAAPEYLYWVGCASSFDERARTAAESTVKLLQRAQVDFAILGAREACTGDPARRMGNEYVFQAFAEQNVATLNEAGVTKIIANCPHCFNTLGNEYPDFGGEYEVIHHSEVLSRLVAAGRLTPKRDKDLQITYHDSCYLARHNDVLAPPRDLVAAVGQPIEMERSGKQTFCCGAGGAHMWMEERGSQINDNRVAEAAATGASTLAVACPFCTVMLDDGVQGSGADLRVADVATLLVQAGAAD